MEALRSFYYFFEEDFMRTVATQIPRRSVSVAAATLRAATSSRVRPYSYATPSYSFRASHETYALRCKWIGCGIWCPMSWKERVYSLYLPVGHILPTGKLAWTSSSSAFAISRLRLWNQVPEYRDNVLRRVACMHEEDCLYLLTCCDGDIIPLID